MAYLAECEVHKIFPVGSPEDDTQLPGFVQYLVGAQMTGTNHSQHAMELIYREDGRRWIVDRRR